MKKIKRLYTQLTPKEMGLNQGYARKGLTKRWTMEIVATLYSSDYFGDASLEKSHTGTRNSRIVAVSDCHFATLDKKAY